MSSSFLTIAPQIQPSIVGTPLYSLLYRSILRSIEDDALSVGKLLPIEGSLALTFQVSRPTVRQALTMLERDGYIRKQRAKPAVVISKSGAQLLERPLGSMSDVLRTSVIDRTEVESYGLVTHALAARRLNVDEGTQLYQLHLKHWNATDVIGFGAVYFPPFMGQKLSAAVFDAASHAGRLSIFPVAEAKTGYKFDRARVSVGGEAASKTTRSGVAEAFGDLPVVRIECTFFTGNVPMQLSLNWFDARVYRVTYELGP